MYYTVIDGTLRTKVDEGFPNAVRREYETKDGAKAVKFERVVDALKGYIEGIQFNDGDYGKTINITLDENDEGKKPIVQFSVEGTYGEDVLKKLPGVDLSKEVRFRPFSFTGDDGRDVRGVEITQGETKIKNFFYDPEKKLALNGYPTPEGDVSEYSKEDWKIFYLQARKFLVAYTQNEIIPKVGFVERVASTLVDADVEGINPSDIPF